jgi:hypothetical protein
LDFVDIIYPEELEIKDTTDSDARASYLDLLLEYDRNHDLYVKLYDKRDDFDFPIVNFPFMCSNIPQAPAYGVYVSQLIRYARACSMYHDFLARSQLLPSKLMRQGYSTSRLKTAFRNCYGRHNVLVCKYKTSVSDIIADIFT